MYMEIKVIVTGMIVTVVIIAVRLKIVTATIIMDHMAGEVPVTIVL